MSLLNIKGRLWALLFAILYLSLAPLLAAIAIGLRIRETIVSRLTGKKSLNSDNDNGRTVLITGGERPAVTVHLARCLSRVGHRVVVTGAGDTCWPQVARFSRHVER